MNLLPKSTKLIVHTKPARPQSAEVSKTDHIILLEPKLSGHRQWQRLPLQSQIDHIIDKASDKNAVLMHSGSTRSPSLSYLRYDKKQTSFSMLTIARKLIASMSSINPSRVMFLCNDKSDQMRADFGSAVTAAAHAYSCPLTTFKKRKPARKKLRYLDLFGVEDIDVARLKAEANGNNIARVLAGLPPNVLHAESYITACEQMARKHQWDCEIFDQTRLQKLGAGAFLAVARGNPHGNAGIVRLRRPGHQKNPWVSLVGKGVCFDTGGVNLKNASGMQEMHEDMQGSSVALGTFSALCNICPDDTIECWLAITENRIEGEAYTPTEIVTASNGTTIEVVHSDAEGRMALADTLHLASKNKPSLLIDYATLTGACVFALSTRYSGAFANREQLNELIQSAGSASGERIWPFPVDEDFDSSLDSEYADVLQCSLDSKADHIVAARFLGRFVDSSIPWIHVDLSSGHHKGGLAHINSGITGVGVRFTCNLLVDQKIHEQL